MKQTITILFLMLSLTGFSQQLTYGSGGTVYNSENKKVTTAEMRNLLANNSEALSLYNAGRSKKTWANVLFYGGLGLVTVNLISAMNEDSVGTTTYPGNGYYPQVTSERSNMTAAIIGGAMIIASIPIKIGYPKKIKSALGLYNKSLAEHSKPEPKTTLLASSNQIGFRIQF